MGVGKLLAVGISRLVPIPSTSATLVRLSFHAGAGSSESRDEGPCQLDGIGSAMGVAGATAFEAMTRDSNTAVAHPDTRLR